MLVYLAWNVAVLAHVAGWCHAQARGAALRALTTVPLPLAPLRRLGDMVLVRASPALLVALLATALLVSCKGMRVGA